MTRAGRPRAARSRLREGLVRGVVGGGTATWLRRGPCQGLPVVVLHGAGLDRAAASWGPVLSGLAARHPVLAPDLPGHGDTAPLRRYRGIQDLAGWVLAFLDALGLERAAMTGVSMGGAAALRAALDAPHRVAAVIPVACYGLARRVAFHSLVHAGTRLPLARLTDPLIARSPVAARIALRSIVHDPATISPEIVAELQAIAAETRAERAFDRFLTAEIRPGGFQSYLRDDLHRLTVPVHFVHGTHDATIPVESAREAARICGAPLTEIEAGHWPMFERPDAYLAAAEPFLDGLAA